MQFGVLGPVETRRDGHELLLGGPKQRALLAILLLQANEVVSRDRLADGLWGERPPASVEHTLDNYVSRLRKALGPERLIRRPPGYVLRVEPGELDCERFEDLFREGREALARGDANAAAGALRTALGLWRGPALADVLDEPFAATESNRLEERRLLALEERLEADLARGAAAELVPELERLVQDEPFRERPLGQLMLALYRAGRQAEALSVFQQGRLRFAEELGLELGPQVRELQRKILAHDASLSATATAAHAERRVPRRRRWLVSSAAAAAVALGVSLGLVLGTGERSPEPGAATPEMVGLDWKSGQVAKVVPLAGSPAAVTGDGDALWTADPNSGTVTRIDLASGAVADRVHVGGNPGALAVGGGSVWVAGSPAGAVFRVDPRTGTVTQRLPLGVDISALEFGGRDGAVWVADATDRALIKIDGASGAVQRTLELQLRPAALAVGATSIWVAGYEANAVAEVDSTSGQTVATISVGNGPSSIAIAGDAVWVVNSLDSTVSRIDVTTGAVVATIPVGSTPSAIAFGGGSVWVGNLSSSTVSQIDPRTNSVVGTAPVGGNPTSIAAADGRLWVGTRPPALHRGGTLRLVYSHRISIDPALQLDLFPLQSDGLTRDGLVTYNHDTGPAGTRLVPDLAVGIPAATEGGTVYTFRLRPHIRYSDGRSVHARDFRRALERVFRLGSGGRDLFAALVGARQCSERPATCDLSRGILTDESLRTVTFHLTRPDPNLLANLSVGGLATPVPAGTPFRDTLFVPIPGTGPYKIATATPREIRYVRNPFFREWSHAAKPDGNPDEIVMQFGLSPEQEVRAIQRGQADWMADNVPASRLPQLRTRFAAQLHTNATTETDFLHLNTNVPPFDDVRARKALNFAIDRRELVRIYGGRPAATVTCQVLPPGVAGYRRYCPFSAAPALGAARKLVAASGTRGTALTVIGWSDDPTISPGVSRYVAEVLRKLGYRVHTRVVAHAALQDRQDLAAIQLTPAGWLDTSAYNFFAPWLSCGGALNHGFFCSRSVDRSIARAHRVEAVDPRRAAALWAGVDRAAVDQAAWVPLVNPRIIDFVSARVRNYQHHPYLGIIADQLVVES